MSKFTSNQNREDLEIKSQENQNIQDNQDRDLEIDYQDSQNNQEKECLKSDYQDNHKKEDLKMKFSRFIETAENILSSASQTLKAIKKTVQDTEITQNPRNKSQLECIRNGVLDFDLLEEDMKRIREQIELDQEAKILGSYIVILKDIEFKVKFEIYLQKQNKTFMQSVEAKVSNFEHLPSEVVNKLETNKVVKLFLHC